MFFLDLDMDDDVAFTVFYDWIWSGIILHNWALIYIHIVLYNTISLLYRIIITLSNLLWFFIIHF